MNSSSVTGGPVFPACSMERLPQQTPSDMIEIGCLAVAFILGAPLNLCAYTKLMERRNTHGLTRMLLLKFHLCFTDLSVIFLYLGIRISSLMTYEWKGGAFLCGLSNMLKWICFASSSNVIVCIAVDRLLTVLFPRDHTGPTAFGRVKWMAICAWILAVLSAVPQFFVYDCQNTGWPLNQAPRAYYTCQTVWQLRIFKFYCSGGSQNSTEVKRAYRMIRYYEGAHTIVLFWLPLVAIVCCYAYILGWVCYHMGEGCGRDATKFKTELMEPLDTGNETSTAGVSFAQVRHDEITATTVGGGRPSLVVGHSRYGHRFSSRSSAQFPALIRAKRKLLRSTLFIISCYILCWIPYNTLALMRVFDTSGDVTSTSIDRFAFAYSFVIFNSVINPFLYGGVFSFSDVSKLLRLRGRIAQGEFASGGRRIINVMVRRVLSVINSKSDQQIPELTVDAVA